MTIRPEILDELLKDFTKPEDLTGEGGILKQLTKALVERCLDAEMDVHLDVKVRENGRVINKAIHLVLAVNLNGEKELLGMWISQSEGAKFWMNVLTELKNRGVQDIFIACVDGLSGFPEAYACGGAKLYAATFPDTVVQLCMVRNSAAFVSYKHRKAVCADLKAIYTAASEDEAELHLELFADSSFSSGGKPSYRNDSEKWDEQYPTISRIWKRHWVNIIPMFNFPPKIRKVMYTTNAIESLNMTLPKVTKNHRVFPNDEAVLKVIYLAIGNLSKKWTMPIKDWKPALNRFAIEFEGRLPREICP